MKRKVLWLAVALILFDVAFVSNARATRRSAAARRAAIERPTLRASQAYPFMTVNVLSAVDLPDQTLLPGKYTFTLANTNSSVTITRSDGVLVGTYVVVPAYRRDATDGLIQTQPDRGADRLVSWFFPNQQDGYSFIFSDWDGLDAEGQ